MSPTIRDCTPTTQSKGSQRGWREARENGTRQKSLAKQQKGSGENQKIVTIFQELKISEMSPHPESKLWAAEDDSTSTYEWPDGTKSSEVRKETTLVMQVRQLSKRLFWA